MTTAFALLQRLAAAVLLAAWWALALPGTAAATCGPATTKGTAPDDFRDYCWLDFTGYSDATARSAGGQAFSFQLPDGTRMSMNLRVVANAGIGSGQAALSVVGVPSWTGSAFGNVAFNGIPGRPILYNAVNASTSTITLNNIVVTPPSGGSATYSMVVGDGESSNANETLSFVTNAQPWQRVAQIPNGSSSLYPALAGLNTRTVTLTGVAGTVGSYVFRSDGNPTRIDATVKGAGLQGIIVGVRYASISVVSQLVNKRYGAADQFTYGLKTTAGLNLVSATSTGTAISGFPVAAMPTVAASYPFVVSQAMAPGSVGTLANYTQTLSCVNARAGSATPMPVNQPVSSFTFASLQYGDSVMCTFTNTPIFNRVNGLVYADANHNGAQDASETSTGLAGLFAKLTPIAGGSCTGPALQAAAVAAGTGAYTLTDVPEGNYCVLLDTNDTLSDSTPTVPSGWIGMQNGSGSVQVAVPAGSTPPPPQNFGLYHGSRLVGTVFADTGAGAGTPNDGVQQGGEPGLAGITVNASAGASVVATAVTAGGGDFILWFPGSVTTPVTLTPLAPGGYLATGGTAGSTGGSYSRPSLTFTPATGQQQGGVGFGLVLPSQFAPNGAQTAQAGSAVFYAHTFQAGSGGQVSFALGSAATPAAPAWNTVLYRDSNCSASLDDGEPVLDGPLTALAGEPICLVLKQFVPAGIASGAQNIATLTASFTFSNASPALQATLVVTDVTTAGEPAALALKKLVANVTRGGPAATNVSATPGEVLQYTLLAQNNGGSPLSTLVIHDATPAFTTFVSAACPTVLPPGILGCTISNQPAVGAPGGLQWTFNGTLGPSAQLVVTYQVKLSQ